MAIHDLPRKKRARKHGDAAMLAKDAAHRHIPFGAEIHFELIVPDSLFKAAITKPTSCTLSTRSGDARRAVLVFD